MTQTKGVKTVDLNVEKRTATIVYDDTQVTEPQIEKTIEKAASRPNDPNSSGKQLSVHRLLPV